MILVIKQIGLSLHGRPILLITRMITDRIGLLSPVTITNRFLFFRGCRSVDILFYLCIMVYRKHISNENPNKCKSCHRKHKHNNFFVRNFSHN